MANSLMEELRAWVGEQLSPIAKPDEIRLTDNLPKTRSGKIMRRLLRSIARGEEITQDMSTLENPGILEQLRGAAPPPEIKRAAPARRPAATRAPAKRPSAKRTVQSKRAATKKKAAARLESKKSKDAVKRAKRVARVKPVKRKVVAARSRSSAVKALRRRPRGKK